MLVMQSGRGEWTRHSTGLAKTFGRLPWAHGMRMLGQGLERWPLSSADSTNVAVNHKSMTECASLHGKAY